MCSARKVLAVAPTDQTSGARPERRGLVMKRGRNAERRNHMSGQCQRRAVGDDYMAGSARPCSGASSSPLPVLVDLGSEHGRPGNLCRRKPWLPLSALGAPSALCGHAQTPRRRVPIFAAEGKQPHARGVRVRRGRFLDPGPILVCQHRLRVAWRRSTHSALSSTHDKPALLSPGSSIPEHADRARPKPPRAAIVICLAGCTHAFL